MAKEISTKFSVDMSSVVQNSIESVRLVRRSEQSRKESEFQKAVANGMSYKDQVSFLEKQLEEEKRSSLFDTDYIQSLESSLADKKKLARFENIRIKYKQSLDDYVGGKESISQHISILEDLLTRESDPEKRQEISDLISSARKSKYDIEVGAVKNRAILAQKDNSIQLIDNSISEVQSKRALASVNENDDEVTAWDDTLLSLRSTRSKLSIENGLNEIIYQTNRQNLMSGEKLSLYNNLISSADASSPVTYDGITYPSLKAYWEGKRGEYISTNYFADVKKESDAQTAVIASNNLFGQVPVARIQAVSDFYNSLKSKSEFALYQDSIEQQRLESVIGMANNLYTSLVDEANSTGNFTKAENTILGIENRFGISIARPAFESEVAAGKTIADTAMLPQRTGTLTQDRAPFSLPPLVPRASAATPVISSQTVSEPTTPQEPKVTPTTPLTPVATTTPSVVTPVSTPQPVVSTTTPPVIPTTTIPTPTEESPQYTPLGGVGTKSPGGKFVFTGKDWEPVSSVAPQSTPVTQSSSIPKEEPLTPQFSPLKGIGATYTNREGTTFRFNEQRQWEQISSGVREKPKTQKATTYTGVSIVDFLNLQGKDSSQTARAKLALEKGLVKSEDEYLKSAQAGTNATLNEQLLKLLRG